MNGMTLHSGDCMDVLKTLPDNSVDLILQDPPYNTTACKWEWDIMTVIDEFWKEWKRVAKDNAAIVMTASQPFTSKLVMSNLKMFRHYWVWNKNNSAGFATVKYRPFPVCEDVLVFGKNGVKYYPVMETRGGPRIKGGYSKSNNYNLIPLKSKSNTYYPKNLISISNASQSGKFHPTQKPVALMEYLIRTYTNEGDTVFDGFMGSGTTGIACLNTGRKFIGVELDAEMFGRAKQRIEERPLPEPKLFDEQMTVTL